MDRPRAIAFDVIGTVFALDALRPGLADLGLSPLALELLYAATLRDSFALACTNAYKPFVTVMEGALDELLAVENRPATAAQKRGVLDRMHDLRPYDDAAEAFGLLRAAGIRVLALSNGAESSSRSLLRKAGLETLVDGVLSAESVKLTKPRPEVYLYAVRAEGLAPETMALIAAHPWDVNGAMAADLRGGYVSRGRPYPSCFKPPTVTGETLLDVARGFASR